MELRITIFLAAVFASLALNLTLLVYLFLRLREAVRLAEANRARTDASIAMFRAVVEGAVAASSDATVWSGRARDGIRDLEPVLLDASSQLGYGLAKVDFEVDTCSRRIAADVQTLRERVTDGVAGPLAGILSAIQGGRILVGLIEFFAESRGGEAPESRGDAIPFRSSNRKIL